MNEVAPELFSSGPTDNALIERRLYWLVGCHMQRRGQELSRRVGLARNTLRAYGDARPTAERADGRTGRRLATLMEIMDALDIDWLAANLAAARARSPEEMLQLTARYRALRREPDTLAREYAVAG
jgi:hypothetical protein